MTSRTAEAAAFYAQRDKRTLEYGASTDALERPICLHVDERTATTRAGQVAVLALVEMLFRVHRHVRLDLPTTVTADGRTLLDVATATAGAIDPFQDPLREPERGELTLTLAKDGEATGPSDVTATWAGGRGAIHIGADQHAHPLRVPDGLENGNEELDVLGAATAACLAAAAVFRLAHGQAPRPTAVNLLTRTCDDEASTLSVTGPVDVGVVDVAGAGAVGHALTYWAGVFGVTGLWHVIDGDIAELHNTNRCLGMTAADAGWPSGLPTGDALHKAQSAAANCDATPVQAWYHEVADERPRPDLVLVLANEYGVRESVARRGESILLHATTSSNWTAELHRHIAGRDDCPACRISSQVNPTFTCSEGPAAPGDDGSADAALPFLSATAGLMLCAALLDLMNDQYVLDGRANHWPLHLELPAGSPIQRNIHRGEGCTHQLSATVRAALQSAHGRRWDFVGA